MIQCGTIFEIRVASMTYHVALSVPYRLIWLQSIVEAPIPAQDPSSTIYRVLEF